jgi:hypothetical protein
MGYRTVYTIFYTDGYRTVYAVVYTHGYHTIYGVYYTAERTQGREEGKKELRDRRVRAEAAMSARMLQRALRSQQRSEPSLPFDPRGEDPHHESEEDGGAPPEDQQLSESRRTEQAISNSFDLLGTTVRLPILISV